MSVTKNVLWVIVWLTAWLLVGCVSPAGIPTPMLSPLVAPQESPTPDALLAVSPLPSPVAVATQAPHTPGMGSVSGELERFDGTSLRGIFVYAALVEDHDGMNLASVDPQLDARSVADAQGHFSFDNLAPGEYALATQSPVGIILPHNTDGEIVRFKIEADGELALGRLAVGYTYPDND
jgi:hypothetical protein